MTGQASPPRQVAAGERFLGARPTSAADWYRPYALAAGTHVVSRDSTTVQVGLEPPRSVLIRDAPSGAADVLRRLDGRTPLGGIVGNRAVDPGPWLAMISGLIGVGLVLPAREGAVLPLHLLQVRTALAHRHGPDLGDRVLRRRQDAMVIVAGSGEVGSATAELLGASGVGEVHLKAERQAPQIRRPFVRPGDPAPQLPPALVILADEHARDQVMAAGLTIDLVPHLAVSTGIARAVIGPLVLPGRSACLNCLDLIRSDIDPGWAPPESDHPTGPFPLLTTTAAALATEQALEHLDGVERPASVEATLEWRSGTHAARRRSWYRHPACGCRDISG